MTPARRVLLAVAGLVLGHLAAGRAPDARAEDPPAREAVDLLVTAGTVLTMDPAGREIPDGAVAVRDGRVVAVGPRAELESRHAPARTIRRPDSVVLPGLVNTHTHAAMSLLRGVADDRALMDWLQNAIFPAEGRNVSPEFVRDGTNLAMAEMIRGGTTTFVDMYYFEDEVARAVAAAGMRAVLGQTWIDFPVPDAATPAAAEAATRKFLEAWKGHRLVTPAVAPHAPYTCSEATLRAARRLADEFGAPLLTHLSETKDEQATIRERHGCTPAAWLERIGFLGPRLLVAHGVWLDPADLALLAARKVALSHNPESNMKLASGIAPVARALEAGVVVGLGTDGPAGSNNDFDMFDAMDFAGKLAKVAGADPRVLPARRLLLLATREGAEAIGQGDRIGSLEPGKEADLIAVDLVAGRTQPVYDVASTLVYAAKASDVSLTVVAGRVLLDAHASPDLPTIDEADVKVRAAAWRRKVIESIAAASAPGR